MRKLLGFGVFAIAVAFAGASMAADGAAIFKSKCSPCHGPDGGGTAMAPAFKGSAYVKDSKEEDIAGTIKNGRSGAAKKYKNFAIDMPAQKTMTDDELKAVVGYLKSIAAAK